MKKDDNSIKTLSNKKKKSMIKKSLIGLIIAILALISFILISFTGPIGKVIGIFFYLGLSIFAIIEFSNILPLPKWTKFYFSLVILLIFVASYEQIWNWLSNEEDKQFLNIYIQDIYKFKFFGIEWIGYPILFVLTIIPFLINNKFTLDTLIFSIISFFVILMLSIVSKGLMFVNTESFFFLFLLILIPIICDTFAYFGGMFLGNKIFKRHKLAPIISPNKTIEGAIIGYIAAWIFVFIAFMFFDFPYLNVPKIYLITIIPTAMPIVAILGDLAFSAIKRFAKIKDFSNIIPSHGGILDRIDSIVLTSFVFIALFNVL